MKRIFNYLFVVSVITFSLLEIVILFSFNTNYYHKQNNKLALYEDVKMEEKDVNLVFDEMFAYLDDKQDSLNEHTFLIDGNEDYFYNEREVLHMEDVKDLFSIVKTIKNITFFVSLVSLLLYKQFDYKILFTAFKQVLFLILCFVAAVGIYAFVDFTSFWISFHEVLFTNDLWLLDPRTCLLIRIMPESLFNDLVMPLVSTLALFFTVLGTVLYFLKGKIKND